MPVVDASVVVDWVAPDPQVARGPARRWLAALTGADPAGPAARADPAGAAARADPAGPVLVGPRLLREEVGNALLTGVRRRRWTGAQADAAYALLQRLPLVERDVPADRDRAYELSRRYDEHPLHDLVYVALAERLRLPLVTADSRLLTRVGHLPYVQPLPGLSS